MNQERLIKRFTDYCSCGSESGDELAFCEMIENELKQLGLETWRDEIGGQFGSNGFNVHAYLEGEGEPIMFSAHLDTATPGKTVTPVIDGDVIRSDGTSILGSDDKSGIAAVMEALECLKEAPRPHRPVEVFFSICEELGLLGSEAADYSKIRSREAVVLDGDIPGCITNQTAGILRLHIEMTGRVSHAALDPASGINALKAAAEVVQRTQLGYLDDGFSVINIANFAAPGESNMVSGKASFDVEIRAFSEELREQRRQYILDIVEDVCAGTRGLSYTCEETLRTAILNVERDSPLFIRICEVLAGIGAKPQILKTFAGCDASNLDIHGIAAIDYGTGMNNVHATDEYIYIKDLADTARFVEGMMDAL